MANEAIIVELLGNQGEVIDFTIADAAGVTKGALMELLDPRTISGATLSTNKFAGIAAADKVASDGATNLGVYTKGIFDLRTGGGAVINAGVMVKLTGANMVEAAADTDYEAGLIVGKALETAAVATAETIEVAIGVY